MVINLSPQDIEDLRRKGFKDEEIAEALKLLEEEEKNELQRSYDRLKGVSNSNNTSNSYSSFGMKNSDDIARWQLELNDILERAEHVLKGDVVVFENGELVWKENPNPQNNTLNKYGVQLCMKLLSMYINRNTILSDYKEDEIRYKVLDFGKRINDLIFLKYEEMGMDTEEKRKEYAALVGSMTDIVHSAYARAKDGRERDSYRKMISVSQSNSNNNAMQGGTPINLGTSPKVRGILNPMRYLAGKYA